MDDKQRMKRQFQLLVTAQTAHLEVATESGGRLPRDLSFEVLALLVLAARVDALEDMLSVALPTAGEGI